MKNKGLLAVISGPAGTGKGTVVKELQKDEQIRVSVSATTRAPRGQEQNGVEYYFLSREQFEAMIRQQGFLEYAEYVGNFYGTPKKFVDEAMEQGKDVVLDIEVQGARQVHESVPDAVMIFIIPPSMEELRRRLIRRGTDSMEAIEGRLMRARQEYAEAEIYDYLIVNEDADIAASEFSAIVKAEHLRTRDRLYLLK